MNKVLITGAGGFIGSNMVAFMKKRGFYVRAADIVYPSNREINWSQADELGTIDLRDQEQAYDSTEDMDMVIHLASDMGGVGYFTKHNYQPFFNNMTMDMNMLEICEQRKIQRLYYSSSACIYPTQIQMDPENVPNLREDMIFPANSDLMYGWEKLMTTMLAQQAPFDVRVGIQHTVYGMYQEIEGERMKFPTAIASKVLQSKKDGKPIEIWGDGKQKRTFLYIDDAMEKIYKVLMDDKYHGIVNIGSSEVVSVEQVARICCDIVGVEPNLTFTSDKPSGVLARGCDNTKFESTYGYKDQVGIREGFTKLIDWISNERS